MQSYINSLLIINPVSKSLFFYYCKKLRFENVKSILLSAMVFFLFWV